MLTRRAQPTLPAGFLAYLTSNLSFYASPVIRDQYAQRNHGLTPTVAFNDVVFAAHAVVLCAVTTSQYFAPGLWGFDRAPGTRPSRGILGVVTGSVAAVVFVALLVTARAGDRGDSNNNNNAGAEWAWLDVVYAVSYVKLLVTLIKYAPQLLTNYRNQSTRGWSIWQVLLDLAGGILSIAQQGIDSWLQRDWSGITGNPVKFALGNASLVYDSVFMVQHYVLYRGADAAPAPAAFEGKSRWTSEEEPLLVDGDDECRRRRRLD